MKYASEYSIPKLLDSGSPNDDIINGRVAPGMDCSMLATVNFAFVGGLHGGSLAGVSCLH